MPPLARLFTVVFVHPCLFTWIAQTTHGSSYHVHPYPSPDCRGYGSPQASPILGRALCLTPRGSPIPGRVSHLNEKFQDSLTLNSDTDALRAPSGEAPYHHTWSPHYVAVCCQTDEGLDRRSPSLLRPASCASSYYGTN
ncbi:Acriflavine resistance protein B, partial [Operophtera brumata]